MDKDKDSEEFYSKRFSSLVIFSNDIGLEEYQKLELKTGDFKEKVRVICPLSYFNYEVSLDAKLLKRLNLIKVPDNFVGYNIWAKFYRSSTNWSDYAFAIEKTCPRLTDLKRGDPICQYYGGEDLLIPSAPREFEILLLSFRLFHPQDIWCDSCMNLFEINDKHYSLSFTGERLIGGSANPSVGYKLQNEDAELFIKFHEFVGSNYNFFVTNQHLKIALSFFESSYHCVPSHQKFINLIIALESILTFDDKSEITNKICLRLSALIATGDKINIYNKVKKFFRIRGNIVHGSFSSNSLSPLADVAYLSLYSLRSIVGACMINYAKLLSVGFSDREIINLLDEAILDKNKNATLKKTP